MFINLSNHPTNLWSNDQLNAAKKLGNILDIPFPYIKPSETTENIVKLAHEYFNKIIDLKPTHIHLVGEFTFTYNLINLLKQQNIICLAATTERITEEINGEKISKFNFIQFRAYY